MSSDAQRDGDELEPGQAVQWHAQYRHWLAFFAPPPVDASACTYRPRFTVFVDWGPSASRQDVTTSLAALRDQTYESWQVVVLCEGASSADAIASEDSRIVSVACDTAADVVTTLQRRLGDTEADFVAYVPAGDELKPDALAAIVRSLDADASAGVVYTDRDQRAADGTLTMPLFKPDWSPALLTSMDYVSGLAVYRRDLAQRALASDDVERDAIAYELALRATESAANIRHIEGPFYTRGLRSVDATERATEAGRRALEKALRRRGTGGRVLPGKAPGLYESRPAIKGKPKVTIVIPTRDRLELLQASVESVRAKTTYDNYEIMLIDNESLHPDTLAYMAAHEGPVYRYPHPFNYARMMNLAAWASDAPYVVFLNNDTEIITPDWIEGMLERCQEPDVGIVGTRIFHMDGSMHHEGITLWRHNVTVAHIWYPGYHGMGTTVREVAAVTGACLMAKSSAFREIDGFDERMTVGYNDVDLCMRIRQAGYRVIQAGNVELYHVAGASRGRTTPLADELFFLERWPPGTTKDPYFPDNLLATWPVAILPP